MSKITNKDIYTQVRKDSVNGLRLGNDTAIKNPLPSKPESPKVESKFNLDEMILLENYAQYLPRGKRQLKLNIPELRDAVLSKDLISAPLTKTSGLNRGGLLSITTKQPKTQIEYLATIQNKNNLKTNPNFAGFKNDFKI